MSYNHLCDLEHIFSHLEQLIYERNGDDNVDLPALTREGRNYFKTSTEALPAQEASYHQQDRVVRVARVWKKLGPSYSAAGNVE